MAVMPLKCSLVPGLSCTFYFATGEPGTLLMCLNTCGQVRSKDSCTFLPFAGDIVSVFSLWYKWNRIALFIPFHVSNGLQRARSYNKSKFD